MFRIAVAATGGFVLVFIEAYIILVLKGYHTMDFGGMAPFINVWAMNFFLLYAILTDITRWLEEKVSRQEKANKLV